MTAVSAAAGKVLLDFIWRGNANAPNPTNWYANLSLGSPTNAAGSEIATGSGITRQSIAMPAASTAAATNSSSTVMNNAAMTWGPLSGASNSFSGIAFFFGTGTGAAATDANASGAGTELMFGLLATVRSAIIGDSLVAATNAITSLMG
jgi:hypothetical protein